MLSHLRGVLDCQGLRDQIILGRGWHPDHTVVSPSTPRQNPPLAKWISVNEEWANGVETGGVGGERTAQAHRYSVNTTHACLGGGISCWRLNLVVSSVNSVPVTRQKPEELLVKEKKLGRETNRSFKHRISKK